MRTSEHLGAGDASDTADAVIPIGPKRLRPVAASAVLVVFGDLLCLNLGFIGGFLLRFGGTDIAWRNFQAYLSAAPIFSIVFVISLAAFDLYRPRRFTARTAMSAIWRPLLLTALFGSSFVLFKGWLSFPRTVIVIGFALAGLLTLGWRLILAVLEARIRGVERVMAIISHDHLDDVDQRDTLRRLGHISRDHAELVAIVDHSDAPRIGALAPSVDLVLVAASIPQSDRVKLVDTLVARGLRVFVIPAAFELAMNTASPSFFYSIEGIELSSGNVPFLTRLIKRVTDIVAAVGVLVVTSPALVLTAIAIRIESPGPALYRQERLGRQMRPFSILKFRSMRVDAEAKTGPVLAMQNDNRITRVGQFIRRTRIDELPQMWNVLLGDMSLVGPRPERAVFVERFLKSVPSYGLRFQVRPGVTGLAQVRAGYAASATEKLRFDILYINQLSILNDLRISVQTVSTMMNMSAADGTIDLTDLPPNITRLLEKNDLSRGFAGSESAAVLESPAS